MPTNEGGDGTPPAESLDSAAKFNTLLHRAVEMDPVARAELLRHYRPRLCELARRDLRSIFQRRFDDSDVVQNTCIEAYKSFDSFRGRSRREFGSWLRTILKRNIWHMKQRHLSKKRDIRREGLHDAKRCLTVLGSLPCEGYPGRGPADRDRAEHIDAALERIPEKFAEAIRMRYCQEMKLREIAQEMDTTVSTVAGYLRRGLRALAEQMAEMPS